MSVLVKDRHNSKIKYVYLAWQIEEENLTFMMKLSARINRVLGPNLLELASQLSTLTVEASEVYRKRLVQSDYLLHHTKLLEAYSVACALDSKINLAYRVMNRNASGAFEKKNLSEKETIIKLDKEANKLGEMMAEEMDELEKELEQAKSDILNELWLHPTPISDELPVS